MSKRGPKPRLAAATAGASAGRFEPPAELDVEERVEFDRLTEEVRHRGTLARTDPMAVCDLARMTCLLRRLYAEEPPDVKAVVSTQNCVRGLRRELALSLQPSRVMLRTNPGEPSDARSYWRERMGGQ